MTLRLRWSALLAHSLVVQVVAFVLRPTSTYRALELDVPAAWLGALSACFAVAPLVLALPAGALADRFGERRMALTGAVLLLASAIVLGRAGDVTALVVGTVLLGVGHLASVIAQQTLVANRDLGTTTRYDRAFGHYSFAASLGQAVGPLVISLRGGGGELPDTGAVFAAATVVAGLAVVLAGLLDRTARRAGTPGAGRSGLVTLLRLPGLPRALLTSCVVLAAVDITLVYLPALGTERGIPAATVGLLLTARAAASMASRLFLGRLSAAAGRRPLLVASTLLAGLCMGSMAVVSAQWGLFVLVVLAGLGLGVGQPITMAWLASCAPPGLRGLAMSLRLVGNRAGQVAIPSAAGALAAASGAAGVLAATAVALLAVGAVARTVHLDAAGDV